MTQFAFPFFDLGIDRRNTACEKWDILQQSEGSDVLPMWVADMDFRSPPAVQEAIQQRAAHGTYGYTCVGPEDAQALVDFWKRRHALALAPESVGMLPCIVSGLRLSVRALTKPGEGVIVQPPVYGPFLSAPELTGRKVVKNPLIRDETGAYRMDLNHLEDCLQAGNRLLLLCNPHNPTGRAWTREELRDLLALCARYDATIVSDEIHADFVFPDRVHVPLLSLPGAEERVILLCAASKTFNVAGLQQANFAAPNAALREKLTQEIAACGVVSGNLLSLVATRAAYNHGDAWLDGLIAYLMAGRDIASAFFAEHLPHIGVSPLESTYLMWLDCRALGLDDAELLRRTRKLARVALTQGAFFGEEGNSFLRLNIGCPHTQLREALNRLKEALKA